jgi:hypothetical protein
LNENGIAVIYQGILTITLKKMPAVVLKNFRFDEQ